MKNLRKLFCLFPLLFASGCKSNNSDKPSDQPIDNGPEITGVKTAVEHYTNNAFEIIKNVKATDGKDGDITASIKYSVLPYCEIIDGSFTPKEAGIYTVFYHVTNSRGVADNKVCSVNVFDRPSDRTGELSTYQPVGKKAKVIIMIGQSNIEGWSHSRFVKDKLGEEQYNLLNSGAPNVKISNWKSNPNALFTDVHFGLGMNSDRFGPEIGITQKLKTVDETFYIAKYCYGGTNLAEEWASFSRNIATGDKFLAAVNHICLALNNLVKENIAFEVSAILWMQGGSDTGDTSWTNAYYNNEVCLTNDFRSLLGGMSADIGIHWIDTLITDEGSQSATGNRLLVDQAKIRHMEEDPLGSIVDTRDCGLIKTEEPETPDLPHYDSLSELKLGEMMGDALLKVL